MSEGEQTVEPLYFQRSDLFGEAWIYVLSFSHGVFKVQIFDVVSFAFDAPCFKKKKKKKKRFKQIWTSCWVHLEMTLTVIFCLHALSSSPAKALVNHINNMSGLDITDCLLLSVTGETVGVGMEDVVG